VHLDRQKSQNRNDSAQMPIRKEKRTFTRAVRWAEIVKSQRLRSNANSERKKWRLHVRLDVQKSQPGKEDTFAAKFGKLVCGGGGDK
jgi:hypothetical protein